MSGSLGSFYFPPTGIYNWCSPNEHFNCKLKDGNKGNRQEQAAYASNKGRRVQPDPFESHWIGAVEWAGGRRLVEQPLSRQLKGSTTKRFAVSKMIIFLVTDLGWNVPLVSTIQCQHESFLIISIDGATQQAVRFPF